MNIPEHMELLRLQPERVGRPRRGREDRPARLQGSRVRVRRPGRLLVERTQCVGLSRPGRGEVPERDRPPGGQDTRPGAEDRDLLQRGHYDLRAVRGLAGV